MKIFKKIFRNPFSKKKETIACIDGRLYKVDTDKMLSKEELEEIAKVKEIVIQE